MQQLNLDSFPRQDKDEFDNSTFSPLPSWSDTDDVLTLPRTQPHDDRHELYKDSCSIWAVELESRMLDSASEDDDSRTRMTISTQSTTALPRPLSSPTWPLHGILRTSQTAGSRAKRSQKKFTVQFQDPDIQPENGHELEPRPSSSSSSSALLHPRQAVAQRQQLRQRQYTNRSVGSSRSQGVLIQLYELWQQTWLRKRILHVITGSVEVVIIIWIVIKASQATLTWIGIQPINVREWLAFVYGNRNGTGTSVKELYAKIWKSGLLSGQWSRREPEAIMKDLVQGTVASTSRASPTTLVYGPAKRVMAHAVTGVAIALLTDGAQRLVRKL
ncbi:hypothetical protein BGZ50_006203 [Haplosporangium sp. Z 11]|nr:hypothetical protein BGZ50_006203 [Haplosporangium sp. Z 11]